MATTTWKGFCQDVDRRDLTGKHAGDARAVFEEWCRRAERRVLARVSSEMTRRARDLAERTGVAPQVLETEHAVALTLGTSRVDLYSVRIYGEAPSLHLGVLRGATSTRFPVLASLPGALVLRQSDEEWALVQISPAGERTETSVEGLVLRAFELLVGTHASTLRAA